MDTASDKIIKARVIALYLPQYHPIPENDKYWGKGFTEWTNVAKAKPLFKGHYQPKLPADLGFYDLRLAEIREAQAELARSAGIEGFMYWHYWLGNNRMLLEKPFQMVLKSRTPNFPFCLGWANHSWSTKTWEKGKFFTKDEMIMKQLYSGENDFINHFNYVLPAFKDERYIKVDGKVLFLVYDTSVPELKSFIEIWRRLAEENGLSGIHFVGSRIRRTSTKDGVLSLGFDAINNGIRNQWVAECAAVGSKYLKMLRSFLSFNAGGIILQKYQYKNIIKNLCNDEDYEENVYPSIIPGYDRAARSGRQGIIYHNNTPDLFGKHVDDVLEHVRNKSPEHKIVLLRSWNEWGEGNYMEPDTKYGHAFLDELKKRVCPEI